MIYHTTHYAADTTIAELIKGVTDKQNFLEMIYTEQREFSIIVVIYVNVCVCIIR